MAAALLATADLAVLVAAVPDLPRLLHEVRAPHAWVTRDGADGADGAAATLASAALWLVAAWVAIGLLAGLLRALPGLAGRCADHVAAAVLPRAVYRLMAGAAGLGVLVAPAAAGATAPHGTAAPHSVVALAPSWPSDAPLPAPAWPTTHSPAVAAHHPRAATAEPNAPAAAERVVVQPGDSLWSIAAAHLPPDAPAERVARTWPRWYGANRAVIGDDPALIRPGTALRVPDGVAP